MRVRQCVMICLLLLPYNARADEVTSEQAQALQEQLQGWFSGLFGSSVPTLPWQITAEGDHYLITWPIHGLDQPTGDVVATATVRSLDANRWSIDKVAVPASAAFTLNIPPSGSMSPGGPMKISYSFGHDVLNGVIDPSFATASTVHSEVDDLALTSDVGGQHQEQHFDRHLVDIALTPAKDGRLDLTMEGAINGWKSASLTNSGAPVAIAVQNMHASGRVTGIRRERVADMLTAVRDLFVTLPNGALTKQQGEQSIPSSAKAQLRLIIMALGDMMTGITLQESADGLQVDLAGVGKLAIKHFQVGFGGEAPDGKLHLWLDLGMAGLECPDLPPKIAAYLPHHVEIKPSLSGIMTGDLQKLALDATESGTNGDQLVPDIGAILLHGDATVGLETLSFDLGPAQVEGTGHVTMLGPDEWHGEAHLSAAGLDDLVAQARTDPQLQRALPVLIMARGLARPDGDHLVWDIVSDGPKVMVNGLDLSELGRNKAPKKPN